MILNAEKLIKELWGAEIEASGCNENGVVWDLDNNEIQDRADVVAVIQAHDPTDYTSIRQSDAEAAMANIPDWATKSPQEAEQWVEDNVNDFATMKTWAKKTTLLVFYLKDATYPGLRD